jgi:hypothetical protein
MASAGKARELGESLIRVRGNVTEAKRPIDAGADVDLALRLGEQDGTTPLHQSCLGGHTGLHGAAQEGSRGHKEIVIYLLDHGANVNVRDKKGFTPLHAAPSLSSAELILIWPTS